jgi:CheY-like chemotaxis protein
MSFDLDQLLDEMEDMFSIKACDKGLQLLVTRDQQVAPYIRSDQIKLRQVLINLLNNALKFTKKGSVTLHVKHGPAGAGASHLQFTVTDTGVGIAEDELDRLFDAFIQAKAGQQAQEGTGLGLAISRSFVRLMGGELYIRSRIGEGTTVSFEIPVQLADANSLASPIGKPMRRVAALAPGQPRYRILVADDRKEARQLIARLLRPVGFELREASNGQEALDIWREWHPQLILMDMRMPLLNGSDTTRMIRATRAGKDTIIIALTASGFEEERTEILTSGCDDFLSKPFEESALFALMQKHLGVSFLFQEEVPSGPPPAAPIETVSLSTLPPRLLASLERSLILLDTAAIKKAVADIRAEDTRLADALTKLTEDFQYDRILQALQEAESNEEERT